MSFEEIKKQFPESEEWNGNDGYNINIKVGDKLIRQTGNPPDEVRKSAMETAKQIAKEKIK